MQGEDAERTFLAPARLGGVSESWFGGEGDFGEGAIGFDDPWLYVPEEAEIHSLEVVNTEFLDANWSDD